jgi:hypothetical protein
MDVITAPQSASSPDRAKILTETFDRVVVVNLARRPERIAQFHKNFPADWPFKLPQRFDAVDGQAVGVPAGWDKGPGAWGCMLSHRGVIGQALRDGISSILVLEDDACPVENFAALAAEFIANVPEDWDGLMFGTQFLLPPTPVSSGVVRCVAANRTHAYAVRGRFMQTLLQFWSKTTNDHCDLVLSSLMRVFKVYAPLPLLIGQEGGYSDVTGRKERLRFLSAEQKDRIIQKSPGHFIDKLVVRVPLPRDSAYTLP